MRKINTAILLIAFCTLMVQGFAFSNDHGISTSAAANKSVCSRQQNLAIRGVKSKPDTLKRVVSDIKAECKSQSKSILSKLFNFEMPDLPFEDFFLAAQKALINKLF